MIDAFDESTLWVQVLGPPPGANRVEWLGLMLDREVAMRTADRLQAVQRVEWLQRSRSRSATNLLLSCRFLICSVWRSCPWMSNPPAFSSTAKTLRAPMGRSSEP
jgi:hypothetical protein